MPVPVFLPTTLDSTEKILAAIEELRGKVPSDPLEAELLNLSGVVPEHVGKAEASDVTSKFPDEFGVLGNMGGKKDWNLECWGIWVTRRIGVLF